MYRKLILAIGLLLSGFAYGQTLEGAPVSIMVPYPAGSSSDIVPRLLSDAVSKQLGTPVIIENRPGANGSIGAEKIARSKPDGHDILLGTTGIYAINPWIYPTLPYDTLKDFAPITGLVATPNAVTVPASSEIKDFADLIATAKANPGKIAFGSAGLGSTSHLCGELIMYYADVEMKHIPYKGPAPAMQDLLGDRLNFMCDNLSNEVPYISSKQLRILAVTDKERSPLYPDVPTTGELGFPDIIAGNWYGMVAPANTPANVIEELNKAFNAALSDPKAKEVFAERGLVTIGSDSASFRKYIQSELERYKTIVQNAKITIN